MSASDNEQASESKPDINRKIQIAVVHEERSELYICFDNPTRLHLSILILHLFFLEIRLCVKVFHAMSKIMDAAAVSVPPTEWYRLMLYSLDLAK